MTRPRLVCACGEGVKTLTLDSSRGIWNRSQRKFDLALDWTCLNGHDHYDWLPEDLALEVAAEAHAATREALGK